MSAPGGKEVGRVSVRVVPNTARFASDLKRELRGLDEEVRVPVDFDVDESKLGARLQAMKVPTVRVPVDFDINRAKLAQDLRVLASRQPIKVPAELDLDAGKLNTQLAALKLKPIKVPVEFDVDQSVLDRLGVQRDIHINVDIDTTAAQAQLAALTAESFAAGIAMRVASGQGTAGFTAMAGPLVTAVGLIVKLGSVGAGLVVLGAGISAAWGAASTAIAAVPAAIGLLGAPIAVVALGLDGIKKAAKTLEPEFKKLKETVSATFEKGLTPILRGLKDELTAMTLPIQAVAQALVGVAGQIATWISQMGGLQQIQTMFLNIAEAIKGINLIPLLDGFTRLVGNQAALSALVGIVNELGLSLKAIADNTSLNEAFRGLEEVSKSLLRAFTALVNNGIKLFSSAWPGLKAGLDGITEFFGKFKWVELGNSVGGVFRGLGEALKNIPLGTVKAIEEAFRKLSEVFQSPGFAAAIQNVADALPGALTAISDFVAGAADIVNKAAAIGAAIDELSQGHFNKAGALIAAAFSDVTPTVDSVLSETQRILDERGKGIVGSAGQIGQGVQSEFPRTLGPIPGQVGQIAGQIPGAWAGGLGPMVPQTGQALQGLTNEFPRVMNPIPGQVGSIAGQIPGVWSTGLQPMIPETALIAGQVPGAMGQGLQAMGSTIRDAVGPVPGILGSILDPMAPQAQGAGQRLVVGFGSGISGLSPTLQQELGLLPPIAQTGFGDVAATVQPGLAGVGPAVTAGLDPAQAALATSLAGMAGIVPTAFTVPLQTALTTAFQTVSAAIPTLFTLPFQTALTTAFTTVNSQIPTLFTLPFQTALTTAFQTVSAAIPTLFTAPFQTALTTAFTTINSQIPTLFTLPFQTALTTAFTTLFAQFPTIFTLPFQTALTTAFTTINALLPTIFTLPFQTAMTTAFATIFALFPTIFTLPFQTAITTSLATIAALIPTLFLPINTAFTTAFAAIVALIAPQLDVPMNDAVKLAMTNFDTAVKDGFTVVQASVQAGVDAIMVEMDRLPPYGQVTGQNLINAMAQAILDGRSQLVNAIAAVIAAAIQAATSMLQIASPSKVFGHIGDMTIAGYVESVLAGKSDVVGAIEDTFGAGIDAGQRLSGALSASMSIDGAGLHARVSAVGTLNAAPAPPVNVWIGNEPFRGQIRSEIGSYDSRMRHARSVRGGR